MLAAKNSQNLVADAGDCKKIDGTDPADAPTSASCDRTAENRSSYSQTRMLSMTSHPSSSSILDHISLSWRKVAHWTLKTFRPQ
jgi:hypothetical protein